MISLTSPVETRAHGWPAGAKLAALCLATVVLFSTRHLGFLALWFVVMLVLYALPGRLFFGVGMRRLRVLWPFVLLIALWHGLTGDWIGGLAVILPMMTAVGLANLVTMTTRLSDMIAVVLFLLRPFERLGLNTRAVALAMALVIRFTPVLIGKGAALMQSWRARSAKRVGWRIVTPFAVLALDDAERVAEALKARGGA